MSELSVKPTRREFGDNIVTNVIERLFNFGPGRFFDICQIFGVARGSCISALFAQVNLERKQLLGEIGIPC